MTERDNFNLAKFIRNNQLLNESFEGFGGYRDLKPLKEDDQVENEADYFGEAVEDMYYADLDSANFDDKRFQADLRANKIKTKIIDPAGPAGYAPVVRYMASKQTLADMITKHWATDPETAREWFDEIKPMNETEDLGGWDDGENPNYDSETGPDIVNEVTYVTDDSEDEKGFVVPGRFDFEDFDDTDLNGSSTEQAIDNLILEFETIIKGVVPKELQYSARIAVKKLWANKLKDWKSNM